jgi:hypothetical protein
MIGPRIRSWIPTKSSITSPSHFQKVGRLVIGLRSNRKHHPVLKENARDMGTGRKAARISKERGQKPFQQERPIDMVACEGCQQPFDV